MRLMKNPFIAMAIRAWYAGYLAAADAVVREREATKKAARKPAMRLAA
jgi:hypothetical protein